MPLNNTFHHWHDFNALEYIDLIEILACPTNEYHTVFVPSVYYQDFVKYATLLSNYNKIINKSQDDFRCDDYMMAHYYLHANMQFIENYDLFKNLCIKYGLI